MAFEQVQPINNGNLARLRNFIGNPMSNPTGSGRAYEEPRRYL